METQFFPQYPVPVAKTVLPNGLTVLTAETGSAFVDVRLVFRTGGVDDGPQEGMAHFIEHLIMSDGTRQRHPLVEDLKPQVTEWGAFTGSNTTVFHFTGQMEMTKTMTGTLFQLCFGRNFTQSGIDQERLPILAEYRQGRSDLRYKKVMNRRYFGGLSPWSRASSIGTRRGILSVNEESANIRYRRDYRYGNAVFVACGGVDHQAIVELVRELAPDSDSATERRPFPAMPILQTDVIKQPFRVIDPCVGFIWQRKSRVSGPDPRLTALKTFLGSEEFGRVYQRLRTELGLIYSLSTSLHFETGVMSLFMDAERRHFESIVDIVRTEIDLLAREGVTEDVWSRFLHGVLLSDLDDYEFHCSKRSWKHWRKELAGAWVDNDYSYLHPNDPFPFTREALQEGARQLAQMPMTIVQMYPAK